VSEFSVASTFLVSIDPSSRHQPFRSASTILPVGIDHPWSASTLPVDIDHPWSASTLPVGIDPSGRHRPPLWSASTLRSVATNLPVGIFALSAHHSFLAVAILTLPLRPSDPLGPQLIQRVGINSTIRFGFLRSVWL
jgi:hypothetical protein